MILSEQQTQRDFYKQVVLILVLMDDTLRVELVDNEIDKESVLILVLMDDTLREQRLMFLCIRVFGVCSSF